MGQSTHHVIIGSGSAGHAAAVTIRGRDPNARITLVTLSSLPFYNRYDLPSMFRGKTDWRDLLAVPPKTYDDLGITLRRNTRVVNVDGQARTITFAHNEQIAFDKLLVCSGGAGYVPEVLSQYRPLISGFGSFESATVTCKALPPGATAIMIGGDMMGIDLAMTLLDTGRKVVLAVNDYTFWPHKLSAAERAKVVGMFMVAVPLSSAIGAPLSSWILNAFTGVGGLASWQWLFIIEALPAVVMGFVVFFYLDDGPADAKWLTAEDRQAVIAHLEGERASREAIRKFSLGEALSHPRVIGLALVYFGIVTGLYGFGFWAPQIVKAFGLTIAQTGWVVAIPFVAGAAVMVPWTHHSDATRERVWHVALPAFLGGLGLIVGSYLSSPLLAMIALTLGSVGTFAALPTFWTLPTALLTGTAAAGGIALINAIGNVGGFVGPYLVGWIKDNALAMKIVADQAGANALSIAVIGGFMIAAGVLTLALGHDPALEEGAHK
jgi:MFS family permease